jgi:hypothetical protein
MQRQGREEETPFPTNQHSGGYKFVPDAATAQNRQRAAIYTLIAFPIILILLYLIPVNVSGQVMDGHSGQPLAGFALNLDGVPVETDSEGRFATSASRLQSPVATVDHEVYQPWQGEARFPIIPLLPANLKINLAPALLQGQVTDSETNQPLQGVRVGVADRSSLTDPQGVFKLEYVPRQAHSLQATADGYIALERSLDDNGSWDGSEPTDLALLPNGLRGVVSDADSGQPLSGAEVRFQDRSTQTDETGFYHLARVAGPGEITVNHPGYLPGNGQAELPSVLSGQDPVDLQLSPTVLAGQILDGRAGEPVPGATVTVAGQKTTSDERGYYELFGLHGANLTLDASLTGYEATESQVDEAVHLLASQPLDVELLPRHLAGRVFNLVVDSPLPGATVIAGEKTAVSDEEGHFVLWGAEAPVTVVVSADGFFDVEASYEDDSELRVTLKPRHAVVTVQDQTTDQRLEAATIVGTRSESTTDAQGVALLRLLEPGDVFTTTAPGFSSVSQVYDGSDQVSVDLYPDTVSGQAVDGRSGEGVMGLTIYVYDGDTCQGLECRGSQPHAIADAEADGRFTVDELPPNPQLMLKAPGYALLLPETLQDGDCGAPYCLEASMEPFEARGFYVPFHYLYDSALIRQRLDLIAQSPVLNAVVVDMKSDFGELAWEPRYSVARDIGVHQPDIMQAEAFLELARERGIYTIARFVTFKDDPLAKARPEWAVRKKSAPNQIWLDGEELAWVDPYRSEVREYEIELAKELAELGFDEVQFDYFRFTGQDHSQFIYQVESTVENRREAISSFAEELMAALKPYGVFTAIDVFGSIILVGQEPLIGQNLAEMAVHLDYLNPMIYPQVWWPGSFPPYDEPVFYPYEVIYDSVEQVREIVPMPTRIRPWLQGYPNNYRPHGYNYGVAEMMIQRQASDNAGGEGWLFWSGGGNFPDAVFGPLPSLADLRSQVAANQAGYR